ncbi:MAG TPA: hypothetical protein VFE62_14060 [Gemmataceae bacterium]|nr:hypothetical protein [Gemmataceae bacterium]
MSDQAWDLDLTGKKSGELDMAAGKAPNGWYRVHLIGVADDNDSGAKILEFQICHGPVKGFKFRQYLENPKYMDSSEKIERAKNKAAVYARRLGLIDETADGKSVQRAFSAALSHEKEYVVKYETRQGEKKEFSGIAGFGYEFYPIGHAKMPAEAYAAVGLPVPANAPKEAASKSGGGAAPAATAQAVDSKMVW